MDQSTFDLVKSNGPAAAVAIVGFWLINRLLAGFAAALVDQRQAFDQALADQRKDFLQDLQTVRASCLKQSANLIALFCLLLFAAGCNGQGGTVADFTLATPIGNLAWKAWTVTPSSTLQTVQNPSRLTPASSPSVATTRPS